MHLSSKGRKIIFNRVYKPNFTKNLILQNNIFLIIIARNKYLLNYLFSSILRGFYISNVGKLISSPIFAISTFYLVSIFFI